MGCHGGNRGLKMDKELAYIDKVTEWFAVNGLNFVVDVVVVS